MLTNIYLQFSSLKIAKIANTCENFTTALAKIVNTSFSSGLFPKSLKTAKVVPIHKGGSKLDVSNYRPISLLGSFSKIYEKLMHKRVLEFFDQNNTLFENQYGLRPGRSCEHALLNAQNSILQSLNKKQISVLLLLDYSKAFDVLDHNTLLHKLEHYGIRGIVKEWFKSYLSDREQFVSINGTTSEKKPIIYGVPQGSILGPLLFVIFINDLPNISNVMNILLFADDTNLFLKHENVECLNNLINVELCKVSNWITANKLQLNYDKTHMMIFNSRKKDTSKLKISITSIKLTRKNYCINWTFVSKS